MTHTVTPYATGHVGLNVTEVARSKRFYAEVFGLEVKAESAVAGREFAFLGSGDDVILTLWQQSAGGFSKRTPGLHHLSFRVESIDRVKEMERRLRELGVNVYHGGIVAHAEGAASGGVYFEDPDGIRLEVFAAEGAEGRSAPTAGAPTCGFF